MEGLKNFWNDFKGAIIGVAIAILIIVTNLHQLIVPIILIIFCAIAGNYIQQNKDSVKDKLKNFIDRF